MALTHPPYRSLLSVILAGTFLSLNVGGAAATALVSPATVTDDYGNSADSSSKISWAALPSGIAYKTNATYDAGGLALLYTTATNFVSQCIPGETPWALLLGIMDGSRSFNVDAIMTLVKWAYGYAAAAAIGVLFIVFFPIVGMCFCCCRTCCKKCGGKMEQQRKGAYKCYRVFYFVGLVVCSVFLGAGMVCTYYTNESMASSLTKIGGIVTSNLDDVQAYLNNTVAQIKYTATQGFNFTSRVIYRDLDNVGPLIGDPVHELFAGMGISSAFDSLLAMDSVLSQLVTTLTAVNTSIAGVTSSVAALTASLDSLRTNVTTTCSGLPAGTCQNTAALTTNFNPASLPSFSSQLNQLKSVQAQNITALVLNGRKQFDNISNIVAEKALPTMTSLKTQLSSFSSTIDSSLAGITGMLSAVSSISTYGATIDGYLKEATKYEQYRWYAGVGLTCVVLLVLVLLVLGLICGCCGCLSDKDALPTKRGACGNCGGALLMASVGFAFIFGWLLMLLVLITFLIGAPLNKVVCQSVRDPELTYLKELVDGGPGKTSLISATKGSYALAEMILSNGSIPLTASGLLQSCKNGSSAWSAMRLSALIDISQMTNYKSSIDVNQSIGSMNVDLSSLTILDSTTQTQMTNMGSSISGIDFVGLIAELNKTSVNISLTSFATSLRTAANGPVTSTQRDQLNSEADSADSIQSTQVAAVQTAQLNMLTSIRELQAVSATVPTQINSLISLLSSTQSQIQTTGVNVVKNASLIFANRVIATADQFVTFALAALQNRIGDCTPVWTLYKSMFDTAVCGYFLDLLDAFWFSLGWCVAFFVPSMIFATKFAKHVRRMNSLDPYDPEIQKSAASVRSSRSSIRNRRVAPK